MYREASALNFVFLRVVTRWKRFETLRFYVQISKTDSNEGR